MQIFLYIELNLNSSKYNVLYCGKAVLNREVSF